MTIKPREEFQDVSRQKKVLAFDDQGRKMIEAAAKELVQMPYLWGSLRKGQWHAAAYQNPRWSQPERKISDVRFYSSEGKQMFDKELAEEESSDGFNDHLLILANSAELMSESEDRFLAAPGNARHCEDENLDKVNGMPLVAHERSENDGFHRGKGPRLSQIRRLARLKGQSLVEQRIEEGLQGGRIRLTQVRRRARCRISGLSQEKLGGHSHKQLEGGLTPLSQNHDQTLSKRSFSLEEESGRHKQRHSDCQTCEDGQEEVAAEHCPKEASCRAVDVETEDKMTRVKRRIRLSQLRREARLRKENTLAQGDARMLVNNKERIDAAEL